MDTSPMPGECSVAGCKGRDDLHSFPESEREKRSWSDFCKRDIVNFETARVCGRHFRDSDYEAMASPPKKLKKGSQPTQQPPGMKGKPATEKCSIEEFQRQLKRLKKEKNILLKRNRLWAKEMKEARRQMSDLRYHNELMAEERDKARKERDALQLEKRHLLKALDEERKEKEALVARKKQEGAELHEAVTESSEIPDCPSMETPTVNVIIVKKENEISHTQNHNEEMKDVESEDTDIEPKNEEEITIKEEEIECNDPLLTFPCKFCETVYTTKYDLENHIKEVHERGDLLSCCSCEKMFHKDIELKLHEVVQHQAKLCKKEPLITATIMSKRQRNAFEADDPDEMIIAKRRRKELTLSDKITLIKDAETSSMTMKKLGEKYGVGKSTVSDILKKKADYVAQFEANADAKRQRVNTTSKFQEINSLTWEWFQQARAKNIPISGPMLREKALSFASSLQVTDFKASNGWLESWRSRYNVRSLKVSGESADVPAELVDDFKSHLPGLCEGYSPENI